MQTRAFILAAVTPLSMAVACSSAGDASSSSPTTPDGGPSGSDASAEIATPNETAGTRLKPLYKQFAGADGSVKLEFTTWYDVERDEPCTIQKTSDGKMRCMPDSALTSGDDGTIFQDDACSKPVTVLSPPRSPAYCDDEIRPPTTKRYIYIHSPGKCEPTRLGAFPSTARIATKTVFQKSADKGCVAHSFPTEGFEVFASEALQEIDAASFALFTVSDDTPESAGRLRTSRTIHSGSDGSKAIASFQLVDGQRNELCSKQLDVDGAFRCMPQGAPLLPDANFFSDSDCKTNALHANADDPPCDGADARDTSSRYVTRFDFTSCRTEIFPTFTAPPLSTVYRQNDLCNAVATSPASEAFYSWQALPSALGPSTFSAIAHVERDAPLGYYGKNGTRLTLRQSGVSSPDGFESLQSVTYYDNELRAACAPRVLDDGKTHCVPPVQEQAYDAGPLYADAACTDEVAIIPKVWLACSADARTSTLVTVIPDRYCQAVRISRLGAPLSLQNVYEKPYPQTTCRVAGPKPADNQIYRVSELTTVPNSTFVELTTSFVK